jgi:hypothetical protein
METMHSDNPYSFVKTGLLNVHAFAKADTLQTLLQAFLNW